MVTDNYGNLVDATTVEALADRLDLGDKRMTRIEDDLAKNTELTRQLAENTAEIVAFFAAVKGAFKVLDWIGRLAKPVGAIATMVAGVAAAWAVFRGAK